MKDAQPPVGGISESDRVQLGTESQEALAREDLLALAARVYEGLSPEEIDEIEEIACRRS